MGKGQCNLCHFNQMKIDAFKAGFDVVTQKGKKYKQGLQGIDVYLQRLGELKRKTFLAWLWDLPKTCKC